jgi:hypothetical protein
LHKSLTSGRFTTAAKPGGAGIEFCRKALLRWDNLAIERFGLHFSVLLQEDLDFSFCFLEFLPA